MGHEHHEHSCDVVGIMEIAGRTGAPRERVAAWNKARSIPEPRWTIGRAPAWCWLELLEVPTVAVYLRPSKRVPDRIWPEIFETLDDLESGSLRFGRIPEDEYRRVTGRLSRNGHGWIAVPVGSGMRLVVTDDASAFDDAPEATELRSIVSALLCEVQWDQPSPTLGGTWTPG